MQISIQEIEQHRRSMETSSDIIFLGLVIGALLLSSSIVIMAKADMPYFLGLPVISTLGYIFAGFLGLVTFYNYLRR